MGDTQEILPLNNLDHVVVAADALFTAWPRADAIIGNPPYLGRRKMIRDLGADYCSRLAESYPEIAGVSDFVTYWFPRAHDALPPGGRAGFVATNTIRQGDSKKVSLDYIVDHGGTITEAVASQPWSGDAQVTVSIVNWVKGTPPGTKTLWLDDGNSKIEVPEISSALAAHVDLRSAKPLAGNTQAKSVFQGQTPGVTGAFELSSEEREQILAKYPNESDAIYPFLGGNQLLKKLAADRWIIDIADADLGTASARYPGLLHHLSGTALPIREAAAKRQAEANAQIRSRNPRARIHRHHIAFLNRWWHLGYRREEMLRAIAGLDRFIAITRTSSEKRGPIFSFVDGNVRIGDTAVAFPFEDDYSLGILQSSAHCQWFISRCTTLETRLTYTSGTVFDSFPWPQSPRKMQSRMWHR